MQMRQFFCSNNYFNTVTVKKQIIYFICSKFFLIALKNSSGILTNFVDIYCINFKNYKRLTFLKKIKIGRIFLPIIKNFNGKFIYCQFLYYKKLKLKANINNFILKFNLVGYRIFFICKRIKGGLLSFFNQIFGFVSYKNFKKLKNSNTKGFYNFFFFTTLQIFKKSGKLFLCTKKKRNKRKYKFFFKKKIYKKRKYKFFLEIQYIFKVLDFCYSFKYLNTK
jgi:hypothetical protein